MRAAFTCMACGETFEKAWTDEAAREASAEVFPDETLSDEPLCGDCYDCFIAWKEKK